MKMILVSLRFACGTAVLALVLAAAGCKNPDLTNDRRPIPLASTGVASPGIGGPGGVSADTRAVGTIATGEGNSEDVRSGVAPVVAAPGSIRAAQGRY